MTGDQHRSSAAISGLDPPLAAASSVVIVDDQPANVALLDRILSDIAEVHGFTDPHVALEHCRRSLPSVVLLDLHMPDLDGFAVMDALNDLIPERGLLPVLVLTADVTTDARDRALASGAKDFLTKPFDRTEVLLRVANLLDLRALHDRLQRHEAGPKQSPDSRVAADGETMQPREVLAATEVAHRLDSLEQHVIDAAHDVTNLLGVIMNFTTFVERQVVDPASLSDLAQIRTAAEQAAALTRDLSALARQTLIPPEPTGINEMVEDVATVTTPARGGWVADPDFRLIFESAPALYLVMGPDLRIVAASDDYLDSTATDRTVIVGRTMDEVFPDNPDDPENPGSSNVQASLERVRRDRVVDVMPIQKYDILVPGSGGHEYQERYWSPVNSPIIGPDGDLAYVLHHVQDVTASVQQAQSAESTVAAQIRRASSISSQLKAVNADLQRKTDELVQAQRRSDEANAAKTEFLSRMSHELRTPLNSILGFAQLLEMGELSEEQRDSLTHIGKGGRHLLGLINDLLDLEQVESGRLSLSLEPVDVSAVADAVVRQTQPMASQRGTSVRMTAPPGEVWAVADSRRLTQVLFNLLGNALKYSEPDGFVDVNVEQISGTCAISVSDDGPGITAEDLPLIFDVFERLGADGTNVEGTGVGLSLVRRFVAAMNGTVDVSSTVGVGSRFTVWLPSATDEQLAHLAGPSPAEVTSPGDQQNTTTASVTTELLTRVILYVEDNPANMALLQGIIDRRHRCRLVGAPTLDAARASLRESLPDAIVLDLHLPDGHGQELLEELRSANATRHIPVIVLTADATPTVRRKLLDAGANEFVTKPLDIAQFIGILNELLPPSPRPIPEGAMPGHGTIRILLVEDESPSRAAKAQVLTEHGYEVVLAADGVQALDAFDRHGGIDLVVSDVAISSVRDQELERHLIERDPAVRVLLLAGDDADVPRGSRRVLDRSACGVDLLTAVREVLDA